MEGNGPIYAVSGEAAIDNDSITVQAYEINVWNTSHKRQDIPVQPETEKDCVRITLKPYSETIRRISMFPRINKHV